MATDGSRGGIGLGRRPCPGEARYGQLLLAERDLPRPRGRPGCLPDWLSTRRRSSRGRLHRHAANVRSASTTGGSGPGDLVHQRRGHQRRAQGQGLWPGTARAGRNHWPGPRKARTEPDRRRHERGRPAAVPAHRLSRVGASTNGQGGLATSGSALGAHEEGSRQRSMMTRRNHARSEGSNASMRGIASHVRTSGPQRLRSALMFPTTVAGSLPKPGWLAETDKLWPAWKQQGDALAEAKRDATVLWLKEQEQAGLDIVTDGEQSRQHFVHGFLEAVEGIDFE